MSAVTPSVSMPSVALRFFESGSPARRPSAEAAVCAPKSYRQSIENAPVRKVPPRPLGAPLMRFAAVSISPAAKSSAQGSFTPYLGARLRASRRSFSCPSQLFLRICASSLNPTRLSSKTSIRIAASASVAVARPKALIEE